MSSSTKFISLVLLSLLCSPIGITPQQYMKNLKIALCKASTLPPEEVNFSDKVFGEGLGMITYSPLPLDVSQRALTWGHVSYFQHIAHRKRSSEKKKLCCSTSQEKALRIYFNEEGDDVNKVPFLSSHPTFRPILPNPGCTCFPLHCPLVWISVVYGLDILIHLCSQTMKGMWDVLFFRLFCLMSRKDGKLAFVL